MKTALIILVLIIGCEGADYGGQAAKFNEAVRVGYPLPPLPTEKYVTDLEIVYADTVGTIYQVNNHLHAKDLAVAVNNRGIVVGRTDWSIFENSMRKSKGGDGAGDLFAGFLVGKMIGVW